MNRTEGHEIDMKTGDIVHFMDKRYSVGTRMTDISVELVELEHPSRGLWVSREAVHRGVPGEIRVFLDKEQT